MIPALAITLVIHFADLAGVPPPVVRETKSALVQILADIDVTVEWSQPSDAVHAASNVIRLTVLPYEVGGLRSTAHAVMGAATRTPLGTGVAWVYYRRVLEQSGV
jgi:hypothetical protein